MSALPTTTPTPPDGDILGEVTDALHARLAAAGARVTDDLGAKVPAGEERVFCALYRVARNASLGTDQRWRRAPVPGAAGLALYARPPVIVDLYYLIAAHAPFRADAVRRLGAVLVGLHETRELIRRPRRYVRPDGATVDATGAPYTPDADGPGVVHDRVVVELVDDLTLADAIQLFHRCDAPYRPYLPVRARCSVSGPLVEAPPTVVHVHAPRPRAAAAHAASRRSEG